ncbi:MAG: hypothetical protein O3A46_12630, partial [Candidatus Poribacteria bacterium]|nr:hypothetical protein [Candidatus Poribacteria bacterium]
MTRHLLLLALILSAATSADALQWEQTNGPYGGFVYSMTVADGSVYAGTSVGTVFRSDDDGLTWNEVGNIGGRDVLTL